MQCFTEHRAQCNIIDIEHSCVCHRCVRLAAVYVSLLCMSLLYMSLLYIMTSTVTTIRQM